jgi:hypothetical protein
MMKAKTQAVFLEGGFSLISLKKQETKKSLLNRENSRICKKLSGISKGSGMPAQLFWP